MNARGRVRKRDVIGLRGATEAVWKGRGGLGGGGLGTDERRTVGGRLGGGWLLGG